MSFAARVARVLQYEIRVNFLVDTFLNFDLPSICVSEFNVLRKCCCSQAMPSMWWLRGQPEYVAAAVDICRAVAATTSWPRSGWDTLRCQYALESIARGPVGHVGRRRDPVDEHQSIEHQFVDEHESISIALTEGVHQHREPAHELVDEQDKAKCCQWEHRAVHRDRRAVDPRCGLFAPTAQSRSSRCGVLDGTMVHYGTPFFVYGIHWYR